MKEGVVAALRAMSLSSFASLMDRNRNAKGSVLRGPDGRGRWALLAPRSPDGGCWVAGEAGGLRDPDFETWERIWRPRTSVAT